MYKNEDLIGNALKKFNIPREEMFICTKIPPTGNNYKEAVFHINKSLENFQTDYIDLILIHWPEVRSLEDRIGVWKALEESVEAGKVKSIGVSNFKILHLKSILEICKIKPSINQIELHPLYIDKETIEFCKNNNILIEAYSPFARMDRRLIKNNTLVKISEKHQKTKNQVLVRWAVQHGWVVIPKSSNRKRIFENIQVDDFELTEEDIENLDNLNINVKILWDPESIKF